MPKGKHSNHARGSRHARWSRARMVTKDGYIKLRVGEGHSLADRNGYALEHVVVWVSCGNSKPTADEVLHHINGDKTDNRIGNLLICSRVDHARRHMMMIPDEDVRSIRERYSAGEDGTNLAREFGIPYQRVYRIVRGETRVSAGGPVFSGGLRGKNRSGRVLDGRTWEQMP